MTFSNAKQIAGLALAWCAALLALDYAKNRHLWQPAAVPAARAGTRVSLWVSHLCCTGCLSDLAEALAPLSAVGKSLSVRSGGVITREQADARAGSLPDYGQWVDLDVPDVTKVDFVALDRAVREQGLVPARIEVGGVEHFRLEAEVAHLCCGMCEKGVDDGVAFARAVSANGPLRWLDSVSVDRRRKRILAHARFLEPGKTVDVAEFMSSLSAFGLVPSSIELRLEDAKPLRVAAARMP